MRSALLFAALLASLAANPSYTDAQEATAWDLQPGTRVRVYADRPMVIGGVRSLTDDSLHVTLWEQPATMRVPISVIRRIDVSTGRENRWRSAGRWAWRTALVFAAIGGVTFSPGCGSDAALEAGYDCDDIPALIAAFGITGVMYGGLFGSFAPRERWMEVRVPSRTAGGQGAQ